MMKKPAPKFKPPIVPVKDVKNPESWAIYGRSGTGKTTFSGTFPEPILLLDVRDRGTASVRENESIGVWYVDEWEDFEDVYWYLKNSDHPYKTVVIDTLTQLQQVCLEHILSKKRKDATRAGDWGSLSRREWGDASAAMKEKITSFRDLPLEVVFLAQERVSVEEEGSENTDNLVIPEIGPAAMKSVASHLNACVSVIGQTFIRSQTVKQRKTNGKITEREDIRYCLRVGANPVYTTKIRKPQRIIVPHYIENPTYQDVINIIRGVD